jgi:hypothetical protein
MIDLKKIHEMWERDSVIDPTKLDEASRQAPILHSKYLQLLSTAKLQIKKVEHEQKILLKDKWLYYNGKMDRERLDQLGWNPDPFNGLKILKGELDYYYNSDTEIQRSEERILYFKTIIEVLTDIIDSIKWRHQTIRNMISWKQFEAGN